MTRNFGLTSWRDTTGDSHPASSLGQDTQANNVIQLATGRQTRSQPLGARNEAASFPPDPELVLSDPPLPFGKFSQAVFDIAALSFWCLFVSLLSVSVPVAVFAVVLGVVG